MPKPETSTAATSVEAFLRGELDPSQITEDDRVDTCMGSIPEVFRTVRPENQ